MGSDPRNYRQSPIDGSPEWDEADRTLSEVLEKLVAETERNDPIMEPLHSNQLPFARVLAQNDAALRGLRATNWWDHRSDPRTYEQHLASCPRAIAAMETGYDDECAPWCQSWKGALAANDELARELRRD